jgi:hypothetical protein
LGQKFLESVQNFAFVQLSLFEIVVEGVYFFGQVRNYCHDGCIDQQLKFAGILLFVNLAEGLSFEGKKVFSVSGFVVFEVVEVFEKIDHEGQLVAVIPQINQPRRCIEQGVDKVSEALLDVLLKELNFHIFVEVDFAFRNYALHVGGRMGQKRELGAWERR